MKKGRARVGPPFFAFCAVQAAIATGRLAPRFSEAHGHGVPIHVLDERIHVLGLLGRLVVQQERMLPNVHDQQGLETRGVVGVVRLYALADSGDAVVTGGEGV